MCNGNKKAAEYLSFLFRLKSEMKVHSYDMRDKIWLKYYEKITQQGSDIEKLPQLLALIHPDFYTNKGISFARILPWEKKHDFTNGIRNTSKCQTKIISGIECIFNEIPEIRGKCEADHIWPNSLGGPSILDNRLLLCKYHNGMKSNDVSNFNWIQVPIWLESYLNTIRNLKI